MKYTLPYYDHCMRMFFLKVQPLSYSQFAAIRDIILYEDALS